MINFIKIPNNFIFVSKENRKEGELPFIDEYEDKFIATLIYIHCNRNMLTDECKFSIREIIEFLGYKQRTGDGNINESIRALLNKLKDNGILKDVDVDLNKVKLNDSIKCNFELFYNVDSSFLKLDMDKIKTIMFSKEKNKLDLLNTYCYAVARTYTRSEDEQLARKVQMTECRSETFYDSYTAICNQLKISENTFTKIICQLRDLKVLFFDNVGSLFKDGKACGNANNVYVLNEDELEFALSRSKFYYSSNGYTIKKKTSEKAKRKNGLKGKISAEKNKNNNTSKLESELLAM